MAVKRKHFTPLTVFTALNFVTLSMKRHVKDLYGKTCKPKGWKVEDFVNQGRVVQSKIVLIHKT